jgi:hypothetical protein
MYDGGSVTLRATALCAGERGGGRGEREGRERGDVNPRPAVGSARRGGIDSLEPELASANER